MTESYSIVEKYGCHADIVQCIADHFKCYFDSVLQVPERQKSNYLASAYAPAA
jgi:hypothetical protein